MKFDEAFRILIENEGSYTNNYNDRGNWTSGVVGKGEQRGTKYGISAMSYPFLDIKNLTIDDVKKIYKKDWWDKLRLDDLPEEIAFDMFDMAVNSGISNSVKILQKTIGTNVDGIIGPNTIKLSNQYNPIRLVAHFNAHRLLFMTNISTWDTFGKGWSRRVANNILLNS